MHEFLAKKGVAPDKVPWEHTQATGIDDIKSRDNGVWNLVAGIFIGLVVDSGAVAMTLGAGCD
jgi:hypothetical protein